MTILPPAAMLASAPSLDLVLRDIAPHHITPHFQPIVDLFTGAVLGYEVLSRGPAPFESPALLFARARHLGLTPELERACHLAAFARIGKLDQTATQWFVNISPEVFVESDAATIAEEVCAHGIDPANVILEITERDAIVDHDRFQRAVRAHADHGFTIALDDFGSGMSGLNTLVSCMPHIIKLDMELTRGLNANPYKQNIVRSVVSLAAAVDARLIAEGVETWQELEMLVRQGVRFAQGRVFADAEREPAAPPERVVDTLLRTITRCSPMASNVDEAVVRLAVPTFSVAHGTMTAGDLEAVFHNDPELDCAVILDGRKPVGIITRTHLSAQMSGPFGYSLAARKAIESIAKPLTLVVEDNASIVRLATLAMDRNRADLYDPVVIVGADGAYHGTVTMRQLIMRAAELELQQARDSNPLTLLPGNRRIQVWIREALESGGTLLYADLDRFKEFNDAFGFVAGDEGIRLTAQVLAANVERLCPGSRLGHLGGDDFVIVAPGAVDDDAVAQLCAEFDQAKLVLFDNDTLRRGAFAAEDRRGARVIVPLTTLSIAVVPGSRLGRSAHPALLSQIAASLKKRAKLLSQKRGASSFIVEQRSYTR